MTFSERLRRLRKQMDMTQEEVARNLNIVRSTYAYYETGKTSPDFNTVIRMAKLFNVTTDYLLDAEKTTTTPTLKDSSKSTYVPSPKKSVGTEWFLRESEQKLLVAFRYLDRDAQDVFLKEIEKVASSQYEQRHSSGKLKKPTKENP